MSIIMMTIKKNRIRKIRKIEEKQMQDKNIWLNKYKYNIEKHWK